MKRYLAASLFVLLMTSPAWGCDSYEDCMSSGIREKRGDVTFVTVGDRPNYLKAIAYKLADIEKELKKR